MNFKDLIFYNLTALFLFINILAGFCMFIYPKVLNILVGKKKLKIKEVTDGVSVIVPVFNEEKYIKRKIENLMEEDYKDIEILIVDNGSTDKTLEIVKGLSVNLLASDRGKINAINAGIKNAAYDVVVVTDADTLTTKNTIKECINRLIDDVGAVGAKCLLNDNIRNSYRNQKVKYHKSDWIMRELEGRLDSVISLDGKFLMFRKSILNEFPSNTLSDDYELGFLLKRLGYRSVICGECTVFEEPPFDLKEELRQIKRRMGQTFLINFRNIDFLFNKKYSYFGMFVFPFRRFFPLLFPVFMLYDCLYLIYFFGVLGLLSVFILSLILFFINRYLFVQILGVTLALYDALTGNIKSGCVWEKINN